MSSEYCIGATERKIATDVPVEAGASVAVPVLPGAELTEVTGGLGDDIVEELEDDAARRLVVDGDVELKPFGRQYTLRADDKGSGRDAHVDVGHGGLGDGGGEGGREIEKRVHIYHHRSLNLKIA